MYARKCPVGYRSRIEAFATTPEESLLVLPLMVVDASE